MLEVILLIIVFYVFPPSQGHIYTFLLMLVIILPGVYAMLGAAPFVPTPKRILKKMMDEADLKPGMRVYDLGCGDGRLVFAAAAQGANAIGYELSIPTFLIAKFRSFFHKGARIQFQDFWSADYRQADVIFCYLLNEPMETFKKKIWPTLKPGCTVISHSFSMRDIEPIKKEGGVVVYVKS